MNNNNIFSNLEMALIIDLYSKQRLFLSKKYFDLAKIQKSNKLALILNSFVQKCRNNHQQFVIYRTQAPTLKLMMKLDLIPKLSTLFTLGVDKSRNIFHFNSCYLQKHGFLTVQSSKMRQNLCRTLQRFNNEMNDQQINIKVNMINGKINIDKFCMIRSNQKDFDLIWKQWMSFNRTVCILTTNHIGYLMENINQIDKYTSLLQDKCFNQRIREEYKKIMDIREHIAISALDFSNFQKQNKKHSIAITQIQNFINNRDSLINIFKQPQIIGKELQIYQFFFEDEYFKSKPKSIQYMKNKFANQFKDYITNPVMRQLPGDNNFGYNEITVQDEIKIKNIDTGLEGGMGKINAAEIKMKYLRNKAQKLAQQQQKFITKLVAIKLPKRHQITGQFKGVDKIAHEMKIVQNFKNSCSAYILKYYRSNQPAFKFKDNLMMDFLFHANTLIQFLQNKKQTLSLSSKLHILLHLANALQFLERHNIVHMDISLNNIIMMKGLMIKVIDFGQAYHPNVCKKDYKPAHTLPFSPPQTFRKEKQFTSKQDVFSFGIITYRLLFDSYPSFSTYQLEKSYMKGNYMQKLFFAPQKSTEFGNINIIQLLINLICRCMSPNQNQRPTLFWICVIIKKILFSIK